MVWFFTILLMKLYFYKSAPQDYKAGFQQYFLPNNIKSMRLLSRVWLIIALLVLGSDLFFHFAGHFKGAPIYRLAYYSYAGAGILVFGLDWFLRKRQTVATNSIYRKLCLGYAYVFAITCLLMSVAVQGNPMNNMTMYLLGLALVATLFVLELKELLLLAVLVEATFVIGVSFLDLPTDRIIMNHTGSLFLILFFFLISRLNFSFRLNHYIQLTQIEQKNAELEALNKAKTNILGVVAHDLRGPFGNIEMMTKMLQAKSLPQEQQSRFYEMILKSCQNSKSIINDLLELARFEQEAPCSLMPTDLSSLIEDVEKEWQIKLKDSRRLKVQTATKPLLVNLDEGKFQRVLHNLISNAVKFTQDNGNININLLQSDRNILLNISDDGIGIPDDIKPHLFEPFSKAGRAGVRGEHSVGLGLSITRKLVEMQQGTIEVESLQQGTSFKIVLPAYS